MRYAKPSIECIARASAAIQLIGGDKGHQATDRDTIMQPVLSTGGAYDLDE